MTILVYMKVASPGAMVGMVAALILEATLIFTFNSLTKVCNFVLFLKLRFIISMLNRSLACYSTTLKIKLWLRNAGHFTSYYCS